MWKYIGSQGRIGLLARQAVNQHLCPAATEKVCLSNLQGGRKNRASNDVRLIWRQGLNEHIFSWMSVWFQREVALCATEFVYRKTEAIVRKQHTYEWPVAGMKYMQQWTLLSGICFFRLIFSSSWRYFSYWSLMNFIMGCQLCKERNITY